MYDDAIFDRLWDRIARRVKSTRVFSDENLNKLNEKETKKAENPIQNAIDELFEAYDKFQNNDKSEKGEEDMSIKVKDLDEMRKEAEEMSNKLSEKDIEKVDTNKETEKTEDTMPHSGRYPFNQAAPWVSYAHKLKALFDPDPDIRIDYIEDMNEVKLYIHGQKKYEALDYLLPKKKVFGNVTLHISLIPSNAMSGTLDIGEIMKDAFEGNDIFSRVVDTKTMFEQASYVIFHKEVAQYFDDNLADLNGMRSTLYQDIADEVFRDMEDDHMRLPALYGVHFCTEVE